MADRPRIDIIHMRDPDSACDIEVYLNGKKVGYEYDVQNKRYYQVGGELHVYEFDPGAGYTKDDVEEMRESTLGNAPEFLKSRLAEIYDSFEPSFERWGLD